MPTYEFRCANGHVFDRFYRTISAAASELSCPECGSHASRQLSPGAGLLFKGSGFYLTDYGKNAHRKAAPEKKSEGASDTSSSATASGESTAKPADSTAKPKPDGAAAKPAKPKSE